MSIHTQLDKFISVLHSKYLPLFTAAMLTFCLYLYTLAPTVTFEDSGDFVTAAFTTGIAHPPGYPLYIMLARLFIFITPLDNAARSIALLSAILGSAACLVVGLIVLKITGIKSAAFFAPLLLGVSNWFWSQSVIAEIYSLNALFIALIFYWILCWTETHEINYIYYLSLTFGLSLTNHLSMLVLIPSLLLYFSIFYRNELLHFKNLTLCAALFAAGMLPYIYLPIAASFDPIHNWGDPSTLSTFIDHVTMRQYQGNQITAPLRILGFSFWFAVKDLWRQWLPVSLSLLIPGTVILWRKKEIFWAWMLLFLPLMIFGINASNIFLALGYFYIPSYLLVSVVMSLGLAWLMQRFSDGHKGILLILIVIVVATGIIISSIWQNYGFASKRDFYLAEDLARQLLDSLPNNAVLLSSQDSISFPVMYLQIAEKYRTDISLMPANQIKDQDVGAVMGSDGKALPLGLPSYAGRQLQNHLRVFSTNIDWVPPSMGIDYRDLVFEILPKPVALKTYSPHELQFRGRQDFDILGYSERQAVSTPFIVLSEYYLHYNKLALAKSAALEGLRLSPNSEWLLSSLGTILAQEEHSAEAEERFKQILITVPSDEFANRALAFIYYQQKDFAKAAAHLETSLIFFRDKHDPLYFQLVGLLADIYAKQGLLDEAIALINDNLEAAQVEDDTQNLEAQLRRLEQ